MRRFDRVTSGERHYSDADVIGFADQSSLRTGAAF